jgi:SAM-dependent methyltransferase
MKGQARRVPPKSAEAMSHEWDTMAVLRDDQILSGRDISFGRVILPALMSLLPRRVPRLLDVGCGTGVLTQELLKVADEIIGVDPSATSIERARSRIQSNAAEFVVSTIEEYRHDLPTRFGAAVANMSLMTVADLPAAVESLVALLEPGGCLVISITHPWLWPVYWGYADAPWFNYSSEMFIESPFRISRDDPGPVTTHVHRPLATYAARLTEAGLAVDALLEPMPLPEVEGLYPERWAFPRFLLLRATKRPGMT